MEQTGDHLKTFWKEQELSARDDIDGLTETNKKYQDSHKCSNCI